MMKHRCAGCLARAINSRIFQFPGLPLRVVAQAGAVVALVEVLEDTGENLGLFVGEIDAFAGVWNVGMDSTAWRRGRCTALSCKERRGAEDGFVGGEEALFRAYAEHDDGGGGGGWGAGCGVSEAYSIAIYSVAGWLRGMGWDQSAVYVRDIWGIVEDDSSLDSGAARAGAVSYIPRPARSGGFRGAVSWEVVGCWDFSGQHGDSMGRDSEDRGIDSGATGLLIRRRRGKTECYRWVWGGLVMIIRERTGWGLGERHGQSI